MTEIKMTLEAIRSNLGFTRPEMAEKLKITTDRYNRLVNGESKMLATELIRLHQISGYPYEIIVIPE